MSELYAPFLREIAAGGRILDAGCGSGRDSLAFLRKGYQVVSIDASAAMVDATTRLTGQEARVLTFDALDFQGEFDGIWACASILHVARPDLGSVLTRLANALKPNGVMYLSFKYGEGERLQEGRYFNDVTEALIGVALAAHTELDLVQVRTSDDGRGQRWLNAIVRRRTVSDDLPHSTGRGI